MMSLLPKNHPIIDWDNRDRMIKKIDHIGIAVKSLEDVKRLYKTIFDIDPHFEEIVEDQKVKVAGLKIGDTNLEFLEATSVDSPITKFILKRGEGLHHIALSVDNIDQVLEKIHKNGLELIDQKARVGAEGKRIAFVHPKSMNGILVELCQESDSYS
jgi:methylmalonyl-CoA epimerase